MLYGIGKYYENKKKKGNTLGTDTDSELKSGKKITLTQNRAIGVIKEPEMEQEWQEHKPKMDKNLIAVDVLINGISFKPMLMNTGYKYYSIINKNFIIKLRLPRIKIPPKLITGFIKENIKKPGVKIIKIAKFSINIQRYKRNIFAYVILILLNLVIIRLLWIKEDNIIIKPATNTLIIHSYSLIILIKKTPISLKIKELTGTPFAILIKRAKKRQKPLTIFKALLKNIIKILRLKIKKTPAEIRKLLPA